MKLFPKGFVMVLFIFLTAMAIGGRKGIKMSETSCQGKCAYVAKDYSGLIGMDGLSEQLLKNHFKLYEGYLKNTNDLVAKIASITPPSLEYSELSRRLGFEFCGMRMHEYYFENLCKGGKELDKSGKLSAKINDCFGSFDTWKKHFVETGKMRGVGWVALFQDPVNNCLYNVWIADHQTNIFVGCKPILVMDVWEHAFMLDYGLDRAKYIDVFFKNINWPEAEKRFTGCCQ